MRRTRAGLAALGWVLVTTACAPSGPEVGTTSPGPTTISLTSVFADGDPIPARYTCDGPDVSPPLAWSGVPEGAVSVAIVVTDPGAADFVHWVIEGLDPHRTGLAEGASATIDAPQGLNGFGTTGWRGPCPPSGTHHYVVTLYALGSTPAEPTRASVEAPHVLAVARLTGTYARS